MAALTVLALLVLAALSLKAPGTHRRWTAHTHPAGRDAAVPATRRQRQGARDAGIADVPLLLELLGAALDAGLSIPWALELVAGVSTEQISSGLSQVVAGLRIGASWEHSWEGLVTVGAVGELHASLSFAALTGAPAAPLLYAEAAQRRRQDQRTAEKRAAALGVRLVVPLGLCSLPAFICLGVVPVVLAMIPAF